MPGVGDLSRTRDGVRCSIAVCGLVVFLKAHGFSVRMWEGMWENKNFFSGSSWLDMVESWFLACGHSELELRQIR